MLNLKRSKKATLDKPINVAMAVIAIIMVETEYISTNLIKLKVL
jgi:hypothetical protein